MAKQGRGLDREKRTIRVMVAMYCQGHHGVSGQLLCPECTELLGYAEQRLEKCPFGSDKGPCSKCRVHCYKPQFRARIQAVMRYAGPRMLTKHPVMGLRHVIKSIRSSASPHKPR
jgi:hypothetical protein